MKVVTIDVYVDCSECEYGFVVPVTPGEQTDDICPMCNTPVKAMASASVIVNQVELLRRIREDDKSG